MNVNSTPDFEVLILAPIGRDATIAAEVLREAGINANPFPSIIDVCDRVSSPAGAILIAEEALSGDSAEILRVALSKQETWSSLPVLLMTSQAERIFSAEKILDMFTRNGSLSILERPFRILTLLTTVKMALKSRERQYQVRDLLKAQVESVRQRDDFLSIASHELKTPMTSLKLQVQTRKRLLSRGDPSVFEPERVIALIDITDKQIKRISRLVDDMLDISRIENGKLSLNLENVKLDQLLTEVYANFLEEFQNVACEVDLKIEDDVWVNCDRYRLEQVIANLFSNAIKYGAGCKVLVELTAVDNRALIKVTDSGMGIAPEHLGRIFDRFERAVDSTAISGLGLGLFISRQIIEMHLGKIHVTSTLGKGSTFTLDLPLLKMES